MSRGKAMFAAGLLLLGLAGRQLVGVGSTEPDLEPVPVSRVVADDTVDPAWTRADDARDPFAPLVLPLPDVPVLDDPVE